MKDKITSSKKNIFAYFVMIIIWISIFMIIGVSQIESYNQVYYNFSSDAKDYYRICNGTVTGAVLSSEVPTYNTTGSGSPKSYYFDGSNDKITFDCALLKGIGSDFSVSVWVKDNSSVGNLVQVIGRGTWEAGAWHIQKNGGDGHDNITRLLMYSDGNNVVHGTSKVFNTGLWKHIVTTYTASDRSMRIYVNGILEGTATKGAVFTTENANTIIGEQVDGNRDLKGWVDEVRIYDGLVLNATAIKNLYNYGNISYTTPVVAKFDITAKNYVNSSNICNFTANVGGNLYTSNISACKVTTTINTTQGIKQNITISTADYINRTYLNYNTSTDLTGYLYQVVVNLNATEIITENALTGTFKAGTQTNSSKLYLNAGKVNITFTKAGYYNKTQEFTFTALQNVSRIIENVSNSLLRINATSKVTGLLINNFTINLLLNNISYSFVVNESTTTGVVTINLLKDQNYTFSIDADGYELTDSVSAIVNAYLYNYTFDLYTTNSIQFNFKDAVTKATINNVSIELISDIFAGNYSTTTGSYYIDLLSPSQYTIRSTSKNYFTNFYEFNLQNRTFTNLTIYLSSNTTATQVTATVIDQYSSYLEGAFIKVLRYDIATNSYLLQEIAETNFEGKTILNIILNSEYYKFIIEYPFGTVRETTNPTYIYASTINFQINTGDELLSNYWNTQDVYVDLDFNNATNNFRYTYSDANNIASQGCLYVYTYTVAGLQLYNSSCVSSASSTILVGVANTTGTTYIAKAYISFDSDTYFMGDYSYTFPDSQPLGRLGVFIILVLTFIVAMTSYYSKTVALILTPMPMVIGAIMGIGVSVVMAILIEIVCIIVAVIISRN